MTHVEARFIGGPFHGMRQHEPLRGLANQGGIIGVYPLGPRGGKYRVVRLDLDPRDHARCRWIEYRWRAEPMAGQTP